MTGVRFTAVLFFTLACVLVIGTPATTGFETLGDPGPALLPRIVGAGTGLLAVILFPKREQPTLDTAGTTESRRIIALSLLAIPAFYLAFQLIGYTIAAALYLFTSFCILGAGNRAAYLRYALAAAAFSLASGTIFTRLLDLPLPGVLP